MKIQDGCERFCTYCIIPTARGFVRSKSCEDIKAEAEILAQNGFTEIVLVGINLTSYGKGENIDLADAVDAVCSIEGIKRVRLGSLEPDHISDEMLSRLKNQDKFCEQFHLSLQSGCDRTLKRMNRHYDTEKYLSIVDKLRQKRPDITLSTDIIVGFPGESDDDFEKTLDILKRVEYDLVYSFIFSPRKGTPAFEMQDQIPEEVKKARFEKLTEVQNEISKKKNDQMIGTTVRVLVDGPSKNNEKIYTSRTEGNKIVHFESETDYTGKFINLKITRADTFALFGEI
jgi:tRNA-2-methylthio-N6-dimethylallyladenosine synthase